MVSQGKLLSGTRTPASFRTLHNTGSSTARQWRGTWKRLVEGQVALAGAGGRARLRLAGIRGCLEHGRVQQSCRTKAELVYRAVHKHLECGAVVSGGAFNDHTTSASVAQRLEWRRNAVVCGLGHRAPHAVGYHM